MSLECVRVYWPGGLFSPLASSSGSSRRQGAASLAVPPFSPLASAADDSLLLGWTLCAGEAVVVAAVPLRTAASVADALRALCKDDCWRALRRECGGQPCVIGVWLGGSAPATPARQASALACARRLMTAAQGDTTCAHPLLVLAPADGVEEAQRACKLFASADRRTRHAARALPLLPQLVDCVPAQAVDSAPGVKAGCGAARSTPATSHCLLSQSASFIEYAYTKLGTLEHYACRPCRVPTLHALGGTALARSALDDVPRNNFDCILAQLSSASFVRNFLCAPPR
ncbi:hypothetical protein EON67_05270, partial [archaeon]